MKVLFPSALDNFGIALSAADINAAQSGYQSKAGLGDALLALREIEKAIGVSGSTDPASLLNLVAALQASQAAMILIPKTGLVNAVLVPGPNGTVVWSATPILDRATINMLLQIAGTLQIGDLAVGTDPLVTGCLNNISAVPLTSNTQTGLTLIGKDKGTGNGSNGQINFGHFTGGVFYRNTLIGAELDGAADAGRISFWTRPTGGSLLRRLILASDGTSYHLGNVNYFGDAAGSTSVTVRGQDNQGNGYYIMIRDGGSVDRLVWLIRSINQMTGADAGADLELRCYSDGQTSPRTVVTLRRATNAMELLGKITVYENIATAGKGVPPITDVQHLVGTASIGATALANTAIAGMYRICVHLRTSFIDVAPAETLAVTIDWSNGTANNTSNATGTYAGGNRTTKLLMETTVYHDATGGSSIRYSTNVCTGWSGLDKYGIDISCERIS